MIRNFFLIAVRNISRHKGFIFINVTGLAVGLAASLLILLWVQDEFSFEKFNLNAENIYRVEEDQFYSGARYHVTVTPVPVGKTLTVENIAQFTVTGVFKDIPGNSMLTFSAVIPYSYLKEIGRADNSWGNNSIYTYVQLEKSSDIKSVNKKLTDNCCRERTSDNNQI